MSLDQLIEYYSYHLMQNVPVLAALMTGMTLAQLNYHKKPLSSTITMYAMGGLLLIQLGFPYIRSIWQSYFFDYNYEVSTSYYYAMLAIDFIYSLAWGAALGALIYVVFSDPDNVDITSSSIKTNYPSESEVENENLSYI